MSEWFGRRFASISLNQVNFYMIVFILLFTVVFSSLLIYDEYRDFLYSAQRGGYLYGSIIHADNLLQDTAKSRLVKVIVEISTLALMLFGLIVGLSKIVNSMISKDMERFMRFFETTQIKRSSIDTEELYFKEFKKMAKYANAMAKIIHEQNQSLQVLNNSLEERVQSKTEALVQKNAALEKEQKFSQTLLESHKQFIRYAIHETHTPLSVIMANIELYVMKEGRNSYLAKIEAAVKNIFSIYDDLSYLVKKDHVDYPKKAIDLREYVGKRVEFFEEVAHFSNVSFEYEAPHAHAWVIFNETKLQRVIDNNITNAIKYSKKKEVVRLGVICSVESCIFWIESKSKVHDVHKIFEAYYRERKKTDGFGLGLNLVKSICDEDNVDISIIENNEAIRFEYTFKKGQE